MVNVDEKIVQCKKDIEALKQNLVALEKEKNTYVPRNGDYGYERMHPTEFLMVVRNTENKWRYISDSGGRMLSIDILPSQFVCVGNIFDNMKKGM